MNNSANFQMVKMQSVWGCFDLKLNGVSVGMVNYGNEDFVINKNAITHKKEICDFIKKETGWDLRKAMKISKK